MDEKIGFSKLRILATVQLFLLIVMATQPDTKGTEENKIRLGSSAEVEKQQNPVVTSFEISTWTTAEVSPFPSSGISGGQNIHDHHFPTSVKRTDDANPEVALEQLNPEDSTPIRYSNSTPRSVDSYSTSTGEPNPTDITDMVDENTNDTYYQYYYEDDDGYPYVLKQISFTKTLYLCEYLFSAMYGEFTTFPDSGIVHDNKSVTVIFEEKFLNMCLPLYEAHNRNCLDRGKFTFCTDEDVLFLKMHGCKRPSSDDVYFEHLLAATLLADDEMCFQSVCSGDTRVIDHVVDGIHTRLFNTGGINGNNSCDRFLKYYYSFNDSKVYGTKNVYWPCCYSGYTVLWSDEPHNNGLINSWSYLPITCRNLEGTFTVFIATVVVIGVVSNLAVITLLLGQRSMCEGSNLLHISLATSDLLIGLFVLAPAMHVQLMLMHGYINTAKGFQSSEEIIQFFASGYSDYASAGTLKSDYYLFSSIIMGSCNINSLLTLFALSFERFTATAEVSRLKELFSPIRLKIFVTASWMLSVLFSLVLMHDDNGITSEWCSFCKFPLGISAKGQKTVLPVVMVILGIVCILTLVFSSSAAFNYWRLKRQTSQTEGTEARNEIQNSDHRVTLTMAMMTLLFFLSTASGGVATIIHAAEISFSNSQLVSYICWWCFLAATSWNPWLYNLSSRQFRNDGIRKIKCMTAAVCWGRSWVPSEADSDQSRVDSERDDPNLTSPESSTRKRRAWMPDERKFSGKEEAV